MLYTYEQHIVGISTDIFVIFVRLMNRYKTTAYIYGNSKEDSHSGYHS